METNKINRKKSVISLITIPLALIIAAFIIAYGFKVIGLKSQKYISVKGLSERKITANIADWSLDYSVTGKTVQELNKTINTSFNTIKEFFKKYNFKEEQIQLKSTYISPLDGSGNNFKYQASVSINVFTNNIENMKSASRNIFDLYSQGVLFSSYSGPNYTYTNINDIKPEMVAEAIQNAQVAAKKFTEKSNVKLGGLKNANQGYFEFLPSDRSSTNHSTYPDKILRVVVSASYYLK